jgi:hypothetical protein
LPSSSPSVSTPAFSQAVATSPISPFSQPISTVSAARILLDKTALFPEPVSSPAPPSFNDECTMPSVFYFRPRRSWPYRGPGSLIS